MRTQKEISKFLDEAFNRVSYCRKIFSVEKIRRGLDVPPPQFNISQEEWNKTRLELLNTGIKTVLDSGYITDMSDPTDGRDYSYWKESLAPYDGCLATKNIFLIHNERIF